MNQILIIGAGKVGNATNISINNIADYHDPFKGFINNDFKKYSYIIICVDTVQSGPNDYKDLESVLKELNTYKYDGLVIIRSTVSPKKIYEWDKKYNLKYIMFPEFMPQRDGDLSTDNAWMAVLGGNIHESKDFAENILIKNNYPSPLNSYLYVSKVESCIIKLANNAGLSSKVIFFNMVYQLCNKFEASFENVRDAIIKDSRIGEGHSVVPGVDGMLGFGGHCLPKDILAIAELDDFNFFETVASINKRLRS